jgi:hypothetical protein
MIRKAERGDVHLCESMREGEARTARGVEMAMGAIGGGGRRWANRRVRRRWGWTHTALGWVGLLPTDDWRTDHTHTAWFRSLGCDLRNHYLLTVDIWHKQRDLLISSSDFTIFKQRNLYILVIIFYMIKHLTLLNNYLKKSDAVFWLLGAYALFIEIDFKVSTNAKTKCRAYISTSYVLIKRFLQKNQFSMRLVQKKSANISLFTRLFYLFHTCHKKCHFFCKTYVHT